MTVASERQLLAYAMTSSKVLYPNLPDLCRYSPTPRRGKLGILFFKKLQFRNLNYLFYNIKYFLHWYIIETLSNTCFQKFFASSTNHRFIELQARAIFIFEQSLLEVRYELFAGNLHRKYEF
jgi:hypothetical protein